MRVLRQEDVEGAAYHEAGHAVAARALGLPVPDLSMIPDEDTVGTCSYAVWVEADEDGRREDTAAVSLAGALAEEIAVGEFNEEIAEDDLLHAIGLADEVTEAPDERDAWLDRAQDRAEEVLRRDWAAVEALAEALLARRLLSAAEAEEIIAEALTTDH